MDNLIGQQISHYKITQKLGEGSMGVVYKADDTKLKRNVALKFLPPELTRDAEAKERFMHEAQAASALEHQNICNIHDIDQTRDEQLFVVMACYDGKTLREKIKKDDIQLEEAIAIFIQICEGLEKSHKIGVIHRDLKPSNIFITDEGTVKIIDFGLAKLAGNTRITKEGTTLGTVNYMSPEQARGEDIDKRTDIWSLGVILYEMLAGLPPFRGEYEQAVIYSILNECPEPLSNFHIKVPKSLQSIIRKCLQKDVKKRYQEVNELLSDLFRLEASPGKSGYLERESSLSLLYTIVFAIFLIIAGVLLLFKNNWFGINNLPQKKHLAILPFNIIGGDTTDKYFCDGLMETITSKLSQLERFQEALWVVPATEVRNQNIQSVAEAKKYFDVNLAMTFSLQHFDESIRLAMNLVDAKSLRQIRSEMMDVFLDDYYLLQNECVNKLVNMLNIELGPETTSILNAGNTDVSRAYRYYLEGKGYLQNYEKINDVDMAINLFTRSIKQDPSFILGYAGLAEAYWRKYELSKDIKWVQSARYYSDQASELNPGLPEVNIVRGIIHEGTGHYQQALQDFQKVLNVNPSDLSALRGIAKSYESSGKIEKAKTVYENMFQLKPQYWFIYNDFGKFYYRIGQYEEAAKQFQKVINLIPENPRGYGNLGACYFQLENWKKASDIFRQALKISPGYPLYSNLGTLYFYQGDYHNSVKMYEKALEIFDGEYIVWGNLAAAYYWLPEKRAKAYELYQRAISLAKNQLTVDPKNKDILSDLASYYATINEPEKANAILKKILAMGVHDVEVLYRIGELYELLGNREEALKWLKKARDKGYSVKKIKANPFLKDMLAYE
jgi:serine/threonine protein kinase/Tfp pilus assembly protein PilF